MQRPSFLALLSLVCCLALIAKSEACRYTVRDVAFVDLGEKPYRLVIVTKDSDSVALASVLKTAADSVLADANVIAEVVDVGEAFDHPVAELAARVGASEFPAALFVSPDDRVMQLDWTISADTTAEQLSAMFRDLVSSPRRTEIFGKVLDVHSVILVIDGQDEKVNREITELAENAISQVEDVLAFMAKPMKHPPDLIHFTREEAHRESLLLWSLGVDLSKSVSTQIAIIFGRGRQLGPVLQFPTDKPQQFMRNLAVVGQDCECGLARHWMQGRMIPHVWTSQDETLAVQKLDFDPGNPLVKAEIDRILSRGPRTRPEGRSDVEQPELLLPAFGYQEFALYDEAADDSLAEAGDATGNPEQDGHPQNAPAGNATNPLAVEDASSPVADAMAIPLAEDAVTDVGASTVSEEQSPASYTIIGLVGAAILIVAVGFLIMLRGAGAQS